MALSTSESIFKDDPFFDQARFLWPTMQRSPLMQPSRLMQDVSSQREDFFSRRAQLVQGLRSEMRSSLLGELCEGLHADLFQGLERLHSSSPSTASSSSSPTSPLKVVATTVQPNSSQDSALTIDTQGFSPDDIRVTVSGNKLEVMATKRAEAADSTSMSNTTSRCSASAASSRQQGFIQRVELPAGVDPSDVTCSLGEDGMLRIETHPKKKKMLEEEQDKKEVAAASAEEETAPARYRTSLDFPITKSAGPEVSLKMST
ncbi:heat shock protein beta-9 [Clupea harengus]|uniref:Heat shock protein beta-9 n=1 Tax=Clupea harengus TaxID=7950 RepID=A0A6P3W7R0_CLUHA|nr:heat shock protein beta-9 [Clupea harengus]